MPAFIHLEYLERIYCFISDHSNLLDESAFNSLQDHKQGLFQISKSGESHSNDKKILFKMIMRCQSFSYTSCIPKRKVAPFLILILEKQ